MAYQAAGTVEAFFDKVVQTMNEDFTMARRVNVDSINPADQQVANNTYWRNVEQESPILEGFDLSGQETDIIELAYPLKVRDPRNDFFKINVADLRNTGFWDRRAKAASKKLNSDHNNYIAQVVGQTGSLYYESSTPGYDFVAEARTILDERQAYVAEGDSFYFNSRDYQVMASDLASREYLAGRPATAYGKAMIGEDIAGFDAFHASYLPLQAAATAGTTTVASDVLNIPEGQQPVGVDSVQNIDYRLGSVALTDASTFAVGDVITFAGVNSLAKLDKIDTGELMTFKVVTKTGNTLGVYPKPIAADQAGITTSQAAYANISTAITSGTVVSKVNVNGGRQNIFWADDSVEIVNSDAPIDMLGEFSGMKVIQETLESGVTLYMAYDADIDTLDAKCRLFTWSGVVNKDPSRNGAAIYVPA